MCRDVSYFQRSYQPRNNVVKKKNGDFNADSLNISALSRKRFYQLRTVLGTNDVRQTEIHTADPLVSESSAFVFEMADEELKRHKSEQHLLKQEVEQFALRCFHLLILFGIRRNCLRGGRSRSLYLYMRVINQTVIIIDVGRSHNKNSEDISFERVEQFTCLGAILTYQNSIHQKTKRRLK